MDGTTPATLDEDGGIIIPAEICGRRGWTAGIALLCVETDDGVLLIDRESALRRVRALLSTAPLVDELIAERRREAAADASALRGPKSGPHRDSARR